jgi:glycine oxidase
MHRPDICIAGAGIIGLSLALELHRRGATVAVLDQGPPLAQASTAAAGMLAAHDPDNPPQIHDLAELSLSLYPVYLEQIRSLSGIHVLFQTGSTLQALPSHAPPWPVELAAETLTQLLPNLDPGAHRFVLLKEQSLDPRDLAEALLAAIRTTTIDLRPHTPVRIVRSVQGSVEVHSPADTFQASTFVDCTGAWAISSPALPHLRVRPKKGQMLAVALPQSLPLHLVLRTPNVYIVPRTLGQSTDQSPDQSLPRAVIGSTIEDAGFDKTVHPADIASLRRLAADLLPDLADAHILESWAGLRPATSDGLPLLGPIPDRPNQFLATGHYRNGILLAPATAQVMAQLISGESPSIDLSLFSATRLPAPTV